jgi:hypothetical protein
MVYWFAESATVTTGESDRSLDRHAAVSDRVTLPYSADQFQRDQHDIAHLLGRLAIHLTPSNLSNPTQHSPFPSRLDLGQTCDPAHCACIQLQLFGDRAMDIAAIEPSDIAQIPEVMP